MISARDVRNLKDLEGSLSWTFTTASADETVSLARAFAAAVMPKTGEDKTVRIGVGSQLVTMVGKSTFVQGLLDYAGEKESIQSARSENPQNIWKTTNHGWIRHYDCGYGEDMRYAQLPSYRKNKLKGIGRPFTDIAEHPSRDKHNTDFDYVVDIQREPMSQRRLVRIVVAPEHKDNEPLQDFASQFSGWINRPRPRIGIGLDLL